MDKKGNKTETRRAAGTATATQKGGVAQCNNSVNHNHFLSSERHAATDIEGPGQPLVSVCVMSYM